MAKAAENPQPGLRVLTLESISMDFELGGHIAVEGKCGVSLSRVQFLLSTKTNGE